MVNTFEYNDDNDNTLEVIHINEDLIQIRTYNANNIIDVEFGRQDIEDLIKELTLWLLEVD